MPGTSSARIVGENAPVRDEPDRADDAAETAEVEIGEHLEDGDAHAVQVVHRELADRGACDDDCYAGVGDLLEHLSHAGSVRGEAPVRGERWDGPSRAAAPRRA